MAGAGLAAFIAYPLQAQDSAENRELSSGAQTNSSLGIIVEGQRLRGQLDVEQAPILELNEEDIAAEGVTSVADLITQISDQTGSARGRGGGGRPVILINGIRVGSFREIANYPPEALARVEVFPEEVAQRFGFAPDRRVINLILKDNYRNAEIELEFEGPSRGGNFSNEQELGFLQIADGARINATFEASDISLLTEDERDIIQTPGSVSTVIGDPDQAAVRSLVDDSRTLEANVSWAKAIIESGVSLSANANYQRDDVRALQGLNIVELTDAVGNSALRTFGENTPLEQSLSIDTFSASGSLTAPANAFRLTTTFDASLSESEQQFDQRADVSGLQADALAGLLAIDGILPSTVDAGFDIARTRSISASSLTTLRGPIADLPGGELLATFDLGYDWTNLESSDTRNNVPVDLTRGDLTTGANLVIPITSRRTGFADALGSFTLNLQAGLQHLSDFGTLGDFTAGLTWSPVRSLDLSVSYIDREVAPTLTQLGNPEVEFLNTPVFDFVNNETVLATVITGGNQDLLAETQRDWKFAANWQLPFWQGSRFSVEYIRNRSDDVTNSLGTVSGNIEAAFPDRFIRDADGTLLSVDRRFVTFSETRSERLSFNLNFRGTIGAGSGTRGGRFGGAVGGRPQAPQRANPQSEVESQAAPPQQRGTGQRAGFQQFRARICAEDGLDVLMRLVDAAESGRDLSAIIPGLDAQRFERLIGRVRGEDGNVDPERLAALREQLCSRDRGGPRAGSDIGQGAGERSQRTRRGQGNRPGGPPRGAGGPGGEGFAAFRAVACADDGEARIRALVARIEAGEDVSDTLPGFDPNMAGFLIERLRGPDGAISSERLAGMRARFCQDGEANRPAAAGSELPSSTAAPARGGSSPGFNPLQARNSSGIRYFVNISHDIELVNEILLAPGFEPLDQLDGQSVNTFGLPRHTSRIDGGIFGGGIGARFSARYVGKTRLEGSGLPGSSDLFFGDLATLNLRLFTQLDQLTGSDNDILKNLRVSLRADNIFDGQRRVVDDNGNTPINFQPLLIDPNGRFLGIELRKLF